MEDLKSDEAFFEELARQTKKEPEAMAANLGSTEEPWRIEFAKATTAPARVKTPPMKSHRSKIGQHIESETEGQLTIDVYQTESEIVVESAIAGIGPEDLDIDVTTDSVTIRGERRRDDEVAEESYIYRECYWGKFSRSIILPEEIDPENASVSFRKGVLSIHLPKVTRQKAKKLKIKLE